MTAVHETTVSKVNHRGRETSTHLLSAANLSVRSGADGELIVELFDEDARVSYKFEMGAEDRARLRMELDRQALKFG